MIGFLKKNIKKNSFFNCLILRYKMKELQKIPAEKRIKERWERDFGYPLNLDNPKTYNEKIQWLKLYGENNPVFGDFNLAKKITDKIWARNYITEKIGNNYLTKIYGIYKNTKKIKFENLPEKFVLKANHDSGSILVVNDKNNIDKKELKKLDCNLKINYGKTQCEWVYNEIKPKIFAEELILDKNGNIPFDYKVFCFQGKPKLIQFDINRFSKHKRNFYDLNWNRLNLEILYPSVDIEIEKPYVLDEMLELSSILSKPFNPATGLSKFSQ